MAQARKRKWTWTGHVARRTDGRWSKRVLSWQPKGVRKQGRPFTRWSDEIKMFLSATYGGDVDSELWMELAQDRNQWTALEADFVNKMTADF